MDLVCILLLPAGERDTACHDVLGLNIHCCSATYGPECHLLKPTHQDLRLAFRVACVAGALPSTVVQT